MKLYIYLVLLTQLFISTTFAARLIDADVIRSSDRTKTWTMPSATGTLAPIVSPVFTTPVLGAASATSLTMGEALPASAVMSVASTTQGLLKPRMTQAQRDAISSPATGLEVYNTDSNKLNVYNGTAWTEVGSGASSINYITDADGSAIALWTTYADAAAASPVDGTGGAASSTFAVSSDSSMRGTSNFLWTHSAANRQGEGFSYQFIINPSDYYKVLQGSFEYKVASGTFADNDLDIWIYDVGNSALIQPAPYHLKNSNLIEKFPFEFQATASGTYRVIGHVATTTATAYTLRFDTFNIGPQAKLYGSPNTDFISYTPTLTNITLGTSPSNRWFYRRVGDSIEINGAIILGTTGALTGDPTFTIPSGLSIDYTKLSGTNANGNAAVTGSARAYDSGPGTTYTLNSYTNGTAATTIKFGNASGSAATSATVPFTWAASDELHAFVKVPILGWSSSVVMSNDADTRVVAARYTTNAGNAISSTDVFIDFEDKDYDTHGMCSGTGSGNVATTNTGFKCTIPVSGKYRISSKLHLNTGGGWNAAEAFDIFVEVNGVKKISDSNGAQATHTTYVGVKTDSTYNFVAGDRVEIAAVQSSGASINQFTSGVYNFLSIEMLQGPAQIAASETVSASYSTNAGNAVTGASGDQFLDFEDKNHDTHGMCSGTGSGNVTTTNTGFKCTIPVSGKYQINTAYGLTTGGGWAAAEEVDIYVLVNGVRTFGSFLASQATHTTYMVPSPIGKTLKLVAGDRVEVLAIQSSGASLNMITSGVYNYVSIIRVGN